MLFVKTVRLEEHEMETGRNHPVSPAFALVLAAALLSVPAFTQVDLSGSWQPAPAEDFWGTPTWWIIWGFPLTPPPASGH